MTRSFDRLGAEVPASPVVLSVPHAGRDYPLALRAALRVPATALAALEDRYVDVVVDAAITGESVLIQRRPRAWIDLNRAEDERDAQIDEGARPDRRASAKVRAGLGLVARRTPAAGELYRTRFAADDVAARIVADHRPYHLALGEMLAAARARFGVAVLLDVHSMPSLASGRRVVIGDRFGQAAAARFVHRLEAVAAAHGHPAALNAPYAGGHILTRHADPRRGVHAIQLEIDRALYLDRNLDRPGDGISATAGMLRAMIDALADEATGRLDQAAE